MATVTYRPREDGDPFKTEWHGIAFEANVPVTIDETKHNHRYVLALARDNPWFEVEAENDPAPGFTKGPAPAPKPRRKSDS